MVDFDQDGINDLIVGAFGGYLNFVKGLGKGDYAQPVRLKDKNGKEIHGGQYWSDEEKKWVTPAESTLLIQPRLIDWDSDGDLDVLNGGRNGQISVYLNEGTAKKASFSPNKTKITVDGKPGFWERDGLTFNPSPEFVDWDGDGLRDLVILYMDAQKVVWAKNTGTKGKPSFTAPKPLLEFKASKPKTCCQLDVADYNGDGKLDLVIGGGYYIPNSKEDSGMWVFVQE